MPPTIVRKTNTAYAEVRREIFHHATVWQARSSAWSPPTDEYETSDAYVVRVEIAGMREEDFEVALENCILHISGVRRDFSERRAPHQYHQMEIRFGKFATSIQLPGSVNLEKSQAEYKDGFLIVVLPKEN